jgi:hypothetical protein
VVLTTTEMGIGEIFIPLSLQLRTYLRLTSPAAAVDCKALHRLIFSYASLLPVVARLNCSYKLEF